MTNSPCIAATLQRGFENEELPPVGGLLSQQFARTAGRERCAPKLVTAVLRALRRQLVLDGTVGTLEVGLTVEEPEAYQAAAAGGEFKPVWDRISGQLLDGELVAKAREEEMQ